MTRVALDQRLIRPHLVGCLGQGMTALAGLLVAAGSKPTGSDRLTLEPADAMHRAFAELQLPLGPDHPSRLPSDATAVIPSSYVDLAHPIVRRAHEQGVPVMARLDAVSTLMSTRSIIGVSGGAGKTTTSAVLHQLLEALEPTSAYVGGSCPHLDGRGYRWAPGGPAVIEACEFRREFLHLRPEVAVVTNLLWGDHADYYEDEQAMQRAFRTFTDQAKRVVALEGSTTEHIDRSTDAQSRPIWVGRSSRSDWQISDVVRESDRTTFQLHGAVERVSITVPFAGDHNVTNTALALVAANALDHPMEALAPATAGLVLPARRVDPIAVGSEGQVLIDDYAHNPEQIRAGLDVLAQRWPAGSFTAIFQPSVHSRVRLQFDDLVDVLSMFAACTILEIQPGSLDPPSAETSVSARQLVEAVEDRGVPARVASAIDDAAADALRTWEQGGSIYVAGSRRAAVISRTIRDRLASG